MQPAETRQKPEQKTNVVIVGQGLFGSMLAWCLLFQGRSVHLIDRGESITASRIAAGLLTPVTGIRMVRSHDYQSAWDTAVRLYRRIEQMTHSQFFSTPRTVRLFRTLEERVAYAARPAWYGTAIVGTERGGTQTEPGGTLEVQGFEMQPAGQLDVRRLLEVTREFFTARNAWTRRDLNVFQDIAVTSSAVTIPALGLTAEYLIFAQGYQRQPNPWFPGVPDGPVRGDILRVRIRGLGESRVVHRGIWLVPAGDDEYLVGSTSDRHRLNTEPADDDRTALLQQLSGLTSLPVEVIEHKTAVRAGMRNYRPVAMFHHTENRIGIINGLGAKGALRAPTTAESFANTISRRIDGQVWKSIAARGNDRQSTAPQSDELAEIEAHAEGSPLRPRTAGSGRRSLTREVHQLLRTVIASGDVVIDATAGNGFDTEFLARQAGENGRVIAMDRQSKAIRLTAARLAAAGITGVTLLHRSHAEIDHIGVAAGTATAITFNLGYLPGGDRLITTAAETSVVAVGKSVLLLKPGGVLTVIAYRGHPGGQEETAAVGAELCRLNPGLFEQWQSDSDPENPQSPRLFVVRRRSAEGG